MSDSNQSSPNSNNSLNMLFWRSAAAVAAKVDRLRLAESRLLQLAHKFGRTGRQTQIEIANTLIPRSVIPLVYSSRDLVDVGADSDSFVMHSVKVSSSQDDETNRQDDAPLVLLHGYMNGAAYFYRNLVGLSEYFGTVHSLDMLGWGLSSRPVFQFPALDNGNSKALLSSGKSSFSSSYSAETFFVESLEAWRKQQGISKMKLAGHSMGGYISVAYAERYPQHVERLILISPAGVPAEEDPERLQRMEEARRRSLWFRFLSSTWSTLYSWNSTVGHVLRLLPEGRAEGLIAGYVQNRLPAIDTDNERHLVSDYLLLNNLLPGSGEYCVQHFLSPTLHGRNPTERRISNLAVPSVTFLYGSNDWMDINAALRVQARSGKRQDVSVYKVQNAGHLLMLDNWREFNSGLVKAGGKTPEDPLPQQVYPSVAHYADVDRIDSATTPERNGAQVNVA